MKNINPSGRDSLDRTLHDSLLPGHKISEFLYLESLTLVSFTALIKQFNRESSLIVSSSLQVKTDNDKLEDSQNAVANYIVKPFKADKGQLIMVRQLTPGKVPSEFFYSKNINF